MALDPSNSRNLEQLALRGLVAVFGRLNILIFHVAKASVQRYPISPNLSSYDINVG